MLSAVIPSAHGYPAYPVGTRTGRPEVRPSRSSRTMEGSSQYSNAYTGYGPNCLTHGELFDFKDEGLKSKKVNPYVSIRHGLYLHPTT